MSPCRSMLTVALTFGLVVSTGAFRTDVATPHRPPRVTSTTLHDRSNDNSLWLRNSGLAGRRNFLKKFSAEIFGTALAPLVLPHVVFAEDASASEEKTTIDKVETLLKDESELDAEVLREEADEKKSIEDEQKLIDELEKEISIEESEYSTPEEVKKEAEKIKDETDALIEEEEQLKNETEEMIAKIESIESEVRSLDTENEVGGDDSTAEKASEAFVDKLKERVEQKEDLITRLKRESKKDIDPKTGKFKTMTAKEYTERVKSTDVDFLQFLKETVANEQEWERDLEAFEGFLGKEFGPAVKELKKDLKPLVGEVGKDLSPLVGEVENELREDVAPAVEGIVQQLESAVEGEVEDIKQRAVELIGKLRSIF